MTKSKVLILVIVVAVAGGLAWCWSARSLNEGTVFGKESALVDEGNAGKKEREPDRLPAGKTRSSETPATQISRSVRPAREISELAAKALSSDRKARVDAIRRLGQIEDRAATDALVQALRKKIENTEEQEEQWHSVLCALREHAEDGLFDRSIISDLEYIMGVKPTVMTFLPGAGRGGATGHKYQYQHAAKVLERMTKTAIAGKYIEDKRKGSKSEREWIQLVARMAWAPQPSHPEFGNWAAQERIKKLGTLGVEASIEQIPAVSHDSVEAMARYFAEGFSATSNRLCVAGLLKVVKSKSGRAKAKAVYYLGQTRSKHAANELMRIMKTTKEKSWLPSAFGALAKLGDEKSANFCFGYLAHDDLEVRVESAHVLASLGEAGIPYLLKASKSDTREVRRVATGAACKIETPNRANVLQQFLKNLRDDDEGLKKSIRKALEGRSKNE